MITLLSMLLTAIGIGVLFALGGAGGTAGYLWIRRQEDPGLTELTKKEERAIFTLSGLGAVCLYFGIEFWLWRFVPAEQQMDILQFYLRGYGPRPAFLLPHVWGILLPALGVAGLVYWIRGYYRSRPESTS